ncbi:GDSL-type esterase/lipase family protein [Bacteroidota bacterium]
MTLLIIIGIVVALIILLYFRLGDFLTKDHPGWLTPPIRRFDKQDKRHPPPANSILCTGSSIMYFWRTIEDDLSPLPVINRGIAGAKINELVYHIDRLVFFYKPRAVLLYAGSNDIQGKKPKSPDQVLDGFREFTKRIQAKQENILIYYISIMPSPARMRLKNWPSVQAANEMIEEFCKTDERLKFIDTTEAFIDSEGKAIPEYFKIDNIHIKAIGYEKWTSIVKPILIHDFNQA